jgi:hypothetical protein
VGSLASISSCVSKGIKAPELVAAGLTAALVCEPGGPKMPIPVVLAGHPVVALKAAAGRFRQAADDGSLVRGFCGEPLDRLPP